MFNIPNKLTQEFVESVFEARGFKVLGKYESSSTPLKCECPEGHVSEIRYTNFKRGHGCRHCQTVKVANARRRSLEDVSKEFEKSGCVLLEDNYKNNMQRLKFKCVCGRESTTSLANFQRGVRCYECGMNRLRGKNNPRWNPDKKDRFRHTKEYKDWRISVLSRDEHTCQKCGEFNWGIVAHHVYSFKTNEELRYDVDNGISLCRRCHTEFHMQFGYNDNDWQDIMEYLTEKSIEDKEPWFAGEFDEDAYAEYLEDQEANI